MAAEPAVEVTDLSVTFGAFTAVDRISFAVQRGEIFGFLGANGAGKTTTIRVLCGLLRPSAGRGTVAGLSLDRDEMAVKASTGYMSQRFTLYDDLTVEENLSFIAGLRKLEAGRYARRRDSILEFISFDQPLDTLVHDLPGGIKQQVALAAAILHDPPIVFLDEPTAGVTPAARARFWALIGELAAQGKTLFVTTHYMDEAEQCGRIALMRTGRIIALDTPAGLKARVFPEPLYLLEAREPAGYPAAQALRHHPDVAFFEPYGMRFHVALKPAADPETVLAEWRRKFQVATVAPTLEDVFIRTIEGGGR